MTRAVDNATGLLDKKGGPAFWRRYIMVHTLCISPIVDTTAATVRILDYGMVADNFRSNRARVRRRLLDMKYAGGSTKLMDKFVIPNLAEIVESPIPDGIKSVAAQYAPQLVATMRDNVRRFARHQTAGSLDTSKLFRLGHPSSRAQFERDAATAFRARAFRSVETPLKIAIVADMNWRIRNCDHDYTPKVNTLAFIVSDAAACARLQCGAYGARGHLVTRGVAFDAAPYDKPCALLSRIAAYGERIRPIDFAFHTDHRAYATGFRYAYGTNDGSGSEDGTGGPSYAREHDGATFVVGIGNFDDADKLDVHLSPDVSLAEAVATIHAALKARAARAA